MPNFIEIGGVTRKPLVDLTRNDPLPVPLVFACQRCLDDVRFTMLSHHFHKGICIHHSLRGHVPTRFLVSSLATEIFIFTISYTVALLLFCFHFCSVASVAVPKFSPCCDCCHGGHCFFYIITHIVDILFSFCSAGIVSPWIALFSPRCHVVSKDVFNQDIVLLL